MAIRLNRVAQYILLQAASDMIDFNVAEQKGQIEALRAYVDSLWVEYMASAEREHTYDAAEWSEAAAQLQFLGVCTA